MKDSALFKSFKVLNDELRWLARRELGFHKITPRTSILYLTYRCDSKCKTCTMWQRPQAQEIEKEIDFAAWKEIIDKLVEAGVKNAEPFGGNALLRKELLIEVLEYLHRKGVTIHLPTNQIGLDDQVAEAIVKYVDTVYLSNDGYGLEQDNVRGVQGAAVLAEQSIDKILSLRNKTSARSNPLRIICNCTVSKFNIGSMEAVAQYALDKGFDEVDFEYAGEFEKEVVKASEIMGITPNAQYLRQGDSILATRDQALQIKKSLETIKKRYHKAPIKIETINIDSLSVENLYRGTIPHKKCYVERTEVTVDPYGNLVICPFITNFIMGNLVDEPFESVWNNEKHRFFRRAQNSGRLPMCKNCILGVQRNPGVLKSVQRIYLSRIKPNLPQLGG